MKRILFSVLAGVAVLAFLAAGPAKESRAKTYNATADVIEACSCPLFCGCYFNSEPNNPHMCTFNMAYQFRPGSHYGDTDLSGARVWLSGDLGGEALSKGNAAWTMVTFDKKSPPAQRQAIGALVGKIYPVKWAKLDTREDDIEWHHDAANKADHAKLGSGIAELTLNRGSWEATNMPTVIKGLKYFGNGNNDGFVLAKGTHYYHGEGDHSYDLKDMNGFFITLHLHGSVEAPGQQTGQP